MRRVFQIVEYGRNCPLSFSSSAKSEEGVFRSAAKNKNHDFIEEFKVRG